MIGRDFDAIEDSFTKEARRLNKKRAELAKGRARKLLPEARRAYKEGDKKLMREVLETFKMPSEKEWTKLVRRLVFESTNSGIIRAHLELTELLKRYNETPKVNVVPNGYGLQVVYPEGAREFLEEYALNISVITDETVKARIVDTLTAGIEDGISNKDLFELIELDVAGKISEWHAETIARTENSKLYNAGRIARYMDPDIEGFVEALQYSAILDTRTTEVCEHLDGRIININDTATISRYTPPNHFNCRSMWLPVTRYEDWKDTWSTDFDPQENFEFTSPLPKLLKGKTEPLVQATKKVDPTKLGLKDIDAIRALEDDDDFVTALKNIPNASVKEKLITERGLFMFLRDNIDRIEVVPNEAIKIALGQKATQYNGKYAIRMKAGDQTYFIPSAKKDFARNREIIVEYSRIFATNRDAGLGFDEIEKLLRAHQATYFQASDKLLGQHFIDVMRQATRPRETIAFKWDAGNRLALNKVAHTPAERKMRSLIVPDTDEFKADRLVRNEIERAETFLKRHVSPRLMSKERVEFFYYNDPNFRAFAIPSARQVHMGKVKARQNYGGVVVHEVGHVLHNDNADVVRATSAFFTRRTEGYKPSIMYEYKDPRTGRTRKEYSMVDKFDNPYTARVYVTDQEVKDFKNYVARDFKKGEEVISMGLQKMYEDPMGFYNSDREYFSFIYSIMKGVY